MHLRFWRQTISTKARPRSVRFNSSGLWRSVPTLSDGTVATFRHEAFIPETPALFPAESFKSLPAISKWFLPLQHPSSLSSSASTTTQLHTADHGAMALNESIFEPFANILVPIEYSKLGDDERSLISFERGQAPLSLFIAWLRVAAAQSEPSKLRLYLAQARVEDLPPALQNDLPTPELVQLADRGDVYDCNLWMGMAPTETPLHRDPNPNLFVQLAGHKTVRLVEPLLGDTIHGIAKSKALTTAPEFSKQQMPSAGIRGDEMMQGAERDALDELIRSDSDPHYLSGGLSYHVDLHPGDGLFIPKRWWHSVKGIDRGITASVNWWFR